MDFDSIYIKNVLRGLFLGVSRIIRIFFNRGGIMVLLSVRCS